MPLFLDCQSSVLKEPKIMPLVLLVPSCRGNYSGYSANFTFVSIVKTIMAMSFLAQTKANRYVTPEDQQSVQIVKEWDIGL